MEKTLIKLHTDKIGTRERAPFMIAYDKPVSEEQAIQDIQAFALNETLVFLEHSPEARVTMRGTLDKMDADDRKARGEKPSKKIPKQVEELLEWMMSDPNNFLQFAEYWEKVKPDFGQYHLAKHMIKMLGSVNRN